MFYENRTLQESANLHISCNACNDPLLLLCTQYKAMPTGSSNIPSTIVGTDTNCLPAI